MHSRWCAALDRGVNSFHNPRIRSKQLSFTDQPQPATEPLTRPTMNRKPFNVIDLTGALRRFDASLQVKVQGWQWAGMNVPVAYAHDCGRERDDTNLSGEGPG